VVADTPAAGRAILAARTPSRSRATSSITAISRDKGDDGFGLPPALLGKVAAMVALVTVARVGVYDRLPGVDIAKFSEAVAGNGLLGYIDNITGGSISNVGVFSLGIIPAINASIFLQVLTIAYPGLKKMARDDGPQGRARYQLYQKLAALGFASVQAFGQMNALRCGAAPHALPPPSAMFRCRVGVGFLTWRWGLSILSFLSAICWLTSSTSQ
jgi:hypothetical protein